MRIEQIRFILPQSKSKTKTCSKKKNKTNKELCLENCCRKLHLPSSLISSLQKKSHIWTLDYIIYRPTISWLNHRLICSCINSCFAAIGKYIRDILAICLTVLYFFFTKSASIKVRISQLQFSGRGVNSK